MKTTSEFLEITAASGGKKPSVKGLAYSALTIGTFAPMLVRRGIAKWQNSLMP